MPASIHEEPHGLVGIARHYIRDLVYGANDGLITTFAIVAGVTGGGLTPRAMLILGAAVRWSPMGADMWWHARSGADG